MITVYGIRACDTCRKALKWLTAQQLEHQFHDLRDDGLDTERVSHWLNSDFKNVLVNRRSTTWRQLSDAERSLEGDALEALLMAHPTLIKRPVICAGPAAQAEVLAVGFNESGLSQTLGL